ncbi:MAG: YidC/Oxa1 family membrane protein insertase [Oscillospiraceae bacterium]|jgi:YidC/Oxa1 family membrane protein insertase|nr:YidC/Oxa1 family membrane protein insertase [Oscillospiraceae bacterium]
MWAFYSLVGNFGIAVLIFTLIVKFAMLPMALRQQKNMAKSQLFAPRMREIQKKYANDRAKQQEELTKLQAEGYNPFGGCGSMLIIMLILFGMLDVVYKPLTHFEHLPKTQISLVKDVAYETDTAKAILNSSNDDLNNIIAWLTENGVTITQKDLDKIAEHQETNGKTPLVGDNGLSVTDRETFGALVKNNMGAFTGKTPPVAISKELRTSLVKLQNYYTKGLQGELYALQSYADNPEAFTGERFDEYPDLVGNVKDMQSNMYFCGLNLGKIPRFAAEPLVLIPILAFLFSSLSVFVSQWVMKKTMPDAAETQSKTPGMKFMLFFSPVFSLWISFTVPAGAGFYWGIGYIFSIAQSLFFYKFFPADKIREEARLAFEQSKDKYKTVIVVEKDDGTTEQKRLSEMSGKEQKEYNRRKLEAAFAEDRLKYGDPDENESVETIAQKLNIPVPKDKPLEPDSVSNNSSDDYDGENADKSDNEDNNGNSGSSGNKGSSGNSGGGNNGKYGGNGSSKNSGNKGKNKKKK